MKRWLKKVSVLKKHVQDWRWTGLSCIQRLFFIALAIIWVLYAVVLYSLSSTKAIEKTQSLNIARLTSLRYDIANLPTFDTVKVGETSGTIPFVQSRRETIANDIKNGKYSAKAPSIFFALNPAYRQTSGALSKHNDTIRDIQIHLEMTIGDTSRFGKFVAYSPTIDLGQTLGLSDAAERLERTKVGLEQTRSSLRNSSLAYSSYALQQLEPLIAQTPALTSKTVPEWSAKITDVQTLVLASMAKRDILRQDYTATINRAVEFYQ